MNAKLQAIHDRAVLDAKDYIRREQRLLRSLIDVDRNFVYKEFRCAHLTPYCRKILNLNDGITQALVRVVNKSKIVPELAEAVISGEVEIYKAKAIASALTPQNHTEWISRAKVETKEQLERAVSEASGIRTKEVTLHLPYECVEDLKRNRDLLCSKLQKYASYEEAIAWALKNNLERHDPLRKAERASPGTMSIEHQVTLRDQDQCTWIYEDGSRCEERKWLHHHHIVFRSHGGDDSAKNLRTLCAGHHRLLHEQSMAHEQPLAAAVFEAQLSVSAMALCLESDPRPI